MSIHLEQVSATTFVPLSSAAQCVIDVRACAGVPFGAVYACYQAVDVADTFIEALFRPVIPLDFRNITNIWYGLESLGNTNILRTKAAVEQLVPAIHQASCLVVCPAYLTEASQAFLWYLYQHSDVTLHIRYHSADFLAQYADWFQMLAHQRDPLEREAPPVVSRSLTLPGAGRLDDFLVDLTQNPFVDYIQQTQRLTSQIDAESALEQHLFLIWQILSTGDTDLAVQCLQDYYHLSSDPDARLTIFGVWQGVLLGLQAFDRILQTDYPNLDTDDARLFNLAFIRGYAALLCGDTQQAVTCFDRAGIDASIVVDSTYDLYKLNALSLLHVRNREIEQAQALQNRLRQYQTDAPALYQINIHYTNQLNLGRLARARGNLEETRQHFDRAFALLNGVKTPSDYLYHNLLLMRLYESAQSSHEALCFALRVACIWSGLAVKNSPNWRLLASLTDEQFEIGMRPGVQDIARYLRDKLQHLAEAAAVEPVAVTRQITVRMLSSDVPNSQALRYYSTAVMPLAVSSRVSIMTDPVETTAIFTAFNQLLIGLLQAVSGVQWPPDTETIYLDLATDDLSSDDKQLYRVCYQVPLDDDVVLYGQTHPAMQGVQQTDTGWFARYKRYHPPERLTFRHLLLLNFLGQSAGTIVPLQSVQAAFPTMTQPHVREMHTKKLIALYTRHDDRLTRRSRG